MTQTLESIADPYRPFFVESVPRTVICMDDREVAMTGLVDHYIQIAGGASGLTRDRLLVQETLQSGFISNSGKPKAVHAREDAARFKAAGYDAWNHTACAAQEGDDPVLIGMHDHGSDVADEIEATVPGTRKKQILQVAHSAGRLAVAEPQMSPKHHLAQMTADHPHLPGIAIPAVDLEKKDHAGKDLLFDLVGGRSLDVPAANKASLPVYMASPANAQRIYHETGIPLPTPLYRAATALRHLVIARYFLKSPDDNPLNFVPLIK